MYSEQLPMNELPRRVSLYKRRATVLIEASFGQCAICSFSTAEESNRRYHYLLSQGVSGLSVHFDLPTQIGYERRSIEGELEKQV